MYLQIFVGNYLRQRRPKLLIAMGAGFDLDARCLISNMSEDAIYVSNVVARLRSGGHSWDGTVTEVRELPDEASARDPWQRTNQGPLGRGEWMDAGSFRDLLARVAPEGTDARRLARGEGATLELTVIAIYASEDLPVAARRRFALRADGDGVRLEPAEVDTEQLRSRPQRRRLRDEIGHL